MHKLLNQLLISSLLCIVLFSSCAKEVEESADSVQKRIIEAYIKVNYGDIEPTKSGMYILHNKIGTGATLKDSTYPFVRYSEVTIEGDYISSTYDSIAVRFGSYSEDDYYGPRIWRLGDGTLSSGVEELLYSMKVGGQARGIIPPWLLDLETGEEVSGGSGTIKIFDLELVGYEEDIFETQRESLESFGDKHYGGVDSTGLGFYYKVLEPKEVKDSLKNDDNVSVYYVGRYLDGRIFDTNIADTAKRHRIYDPSALSKYNALSVKYMNDFQKMLDEDDNTYVKGFTKLVSHMKYGERALGFFDSDWGYGASGNINGNSGIPEYTPISFEIYIVDDREDEDKDDKKE